MIMLNGLSEKYKSRNYGLDICRIFAMIGIVTLHVLGQGGAMSIPLEDSKYWILWIVKIFAYGSVNVFGLLSGYLGINKKHFSSQRLIELIITVFIYTFIIVCLFYFIDSSVFDGTKDVLSSLIPFTDETYWYITCYVLLFLLMPYLNVGINALKDEQRKTLFVVLIISLSLIPSLTTIDLFRAKSGYSALWLITLYLIGALYNKLNKKFFYKWSWLIVIFCSSFVFGTKVCIFYVFGKESNYLISYVSFPILISSIFFLQIFANLKIEIKFKRIIIYFSSAAFDVYILHCSPLIYSNIIKDNFKWIAELPIFALPFIVIGCAIIIYLICVLIYTIRKIVFKVLKLEAFFKCVSKPFDRIFFKGF